MQGVAQLTFFVLFASVVVFLTCRQDFCAQVPECVEQQDKSDRNLFRWISQSCTASIVTLLAREAFALLCIYVEERDSHLELLCLPSAKIPSLLLCGCLLVLCATEVTLASSQAWNHAVPPVPGFRETWSYVQTLRYGEWLINQPLLLLLVGRFVLGRPLSETLRPIAITEVYICLAWVALMMRMAVYRWLLIILTFGLFGWSTYDMVHWVKNYLQVAPAQLPGRYGRVLLLAWLLLLFTTYGIVFLMDILGFLSPSQVYLVYEIFDCTSKITARLFLTYLRSSERHQAMTELVEVHKSMNRASLSLLRSGFEYVLPCQLDRHGNCYVLATPNADVQALELLTGRALAGTLFTEILDSQRDRELFRAHLQAGMKQEQCDRTAELEARQVTSEKASFWNSLAWHQPPISVAPAFNYDITGAITDSSGLRKVPVHMHLSSSSIVSSKYATGANMIIGLRIMQDATIMTTPPSTSTADTRHTMNVSSSMSSASSSKPDDPMAYEYSVAFDAGNPEFKILRSGLENFCGGLLEDSSLMDMVPASCKDMFESWVCEEVQGAPDHRQVLSRTSLSNLPMHAKIGVVADRAWLDIPCPMEPSAADLPITLKVQGIRPLCNEDSVTPGVFKRRQQSSLASNLQQVSERMKDHEVQSMPISPTDSVSQPGDRHVLSAGNIAFQGRCQSLPGALVPDSLRSRSIIKARGDTGD